MWTPLPAPWTRYDVDRFGHVRNRGTGHLISPWRHQHGYRLVTLRKDDGAKTHAYVHRLVLLAFVGAPPPGHECNHLDGDKANNCLENLEYVTRSGNVHHSYDTLGRVRPRTFPPVLNRAQGERVGNSKLLASDVVAIRARYAAGDRQEDIAQSYGVTQVTVSLIVREKTWRHLLHSQ